jgi:hypothetical protein
LVLGRGRFYTLITMALQKTKKKRLHSNWDFDYEVGPFTTYPCKNFKL